MSEGQAEDYHRSQVETFAGTPVDLVTAITMNYAAEAIGIARAAQKAALPVVISVTVETDGRLPTGQSLGDAIKEIDEATSTYPSYFMINCATPRTSAALSMGTRRGRAASGDLGPTLQ